MAEDNYRISTTKERAIILKDVIDKHKGAKGLVDDSSRIDDIDKVFAEEINAVIVAPANSTPNDTVRIQGLYQGSTNIPFYADVWQNYKNGIVVLQPATTSAARTVDLAQLVEESSEENVWNVRVTNDASFILAVNLKDYSNMENDSNEYYILKDSSIYSGSETTSREDDYVYHMASCINTGKTTTMSGGTHDVYLCMVHRYVHASESEAQGGGGGGAAVSVTYLKPNNVTAFVSDVTLTISSTGQLVITFVKTSFSSETRQLLEPV